MSDHGLTADSYIDPPRIDEDSTDTTDYKTVLEHIVEDIYCNKAQDVFTSLVQIKQVRRIHSSWYKIKVYQNMSFLEVIVKGQQIGLSRSEIQYNHCCYFVVVTEARRKGN